MGGGQYGHARQPKYRCLAVAQRRAHAGGYVTMALAEAEVHDWLVQLSRAVDEVATQARDRAPARARRRRDADAIAREITQVEQQLQRLTVQHARGVVPEAAYLAARDEIEADRARLVERHAQAGVAAAPAAVGPLAAQLVADWEAGVLSVAERRAVLRRLVARVEVRPGRPRAAVSIIAQG